MEDSGVEIEWPNGKHSFAKQGRGWLEGSQAANFNIPTGCLGGSCGACEIEVNGKIVRACISTVQKGNTKKLKVELVEDPYW